MEMKETEDAQTRSIDHVSTASSSSTGSKFTDSNRNRKKNRKEAGKTHRPAKAIEDNAPPTAAPAEDSPDFFAMEASLRELSDYDQELKEFDFAKWAKPKSKTSKKARREASQIVHKPAAVAKISAPAAAASVLEALEFLAEPASSVLVRPGTDECPVPGEVYNITNKSLSEKEWQTVLKKRQKKVQEIGN